MAPEVVARAQPTPVGVGLPAGAPQPAERVNVRWMTPLGEEVASTA